MYAPASDEPIRIFEDFTHMWCDEFLLEGRIGIN